MSFRAVSATVKNPHCVQDETKQPLFQQMMRLVMSENIYICAIFRFTAWSFEKENINFTFTVSLF
jgi:hypothetical protein